MIFIQLVSIMLKREIPGTIDVEGREFFYIQDFNNEDFHKLIHTALDATPDFPFPTHGGVIEEKVRVSLAGGISMMGLSYKGDNDGWREKFVEYCKSTSRMYGFGRNSQLFLSNGEELFFDSLDVTFED